VTSASNGEKKRRDQQKQQRGKGGGGGKYNDILGLGTKISRRPRRKRGCDWEKRRGRSKGALEHSREGERTSLRAEAGTLSSRACLTL